MNTEKTILIDSNLHKKLKCYCVENNIKIKELVSKLIIYMMEKEIEKR